MCFTDTIHIRRIVLGNCKVQEMPHQAQKTRKTSVLISAWHNSAPTRHGPLGAARVLVGLHRNVVPSAAPVVERRSVLQTEQILIMSQIQILIQLICSALFRFLKRRRDQLCPLYFAPHPVVLVPLRAGAHARRQHAEVHMACIALQLKPGEAFFRIEIVLGTEMLRKSR